MQRRNCFRAYLIGCDGHVVHRHDLEDCEDEEAAKQQARLLVDGLDVELWDGARKIETFKQQN